MSPMTAPSPPLVCPGCGGHNIYRLGWIDINAGDNLLVDWEKDRNDPRAAQVECGDCDQLITVSELGDLRLVEAAS